MLADILPIALKAVRLLLLVSANARRAAILALKANALVWANT
jgi:hypothetical protein